MNICKIQEFNKRCRRIAALRTDNIYELTRMRIVRVMRECEGNVQLSAEKSGCSPGTIRRYMNFVPFEHLLNDPALADRFDWRTMDSRRWKKLLRRHPDFISRMSKKQKSILSHREKVDIIIAHPLLADYLGIADLEEFSLAELLIYRPEFAARCDLSTVVGCAARNLLLKRPEFFDRLDISTLLPYHWTLLAKRQPVIKQKMKEKLPEEWPLNYQIHSLQFHPEFEKEFIYWDKIEDADLADLKRRQPEIFDRRFNCGLARAIPTTESPR